MSSNILPIILQHVRELATVNLGGTKSDRYKILTPFPPDLNDFPQFSQENLEFTDPGTDAADATNNVTLAYDHFLRTNSLYYNYSYGIKSGDYSLTQVCDKFYGTAVMEDADAIEFSTRRKLMHDAYKFRFKRQTTDTARYDFWYTSNTPVQWNVGRVQLTAGEIERFKEAAIAVYSSIGDMDNDIIKKLSEEIAAQSYSQIEYDFGFFDVIRDWIDPQLWESNRWKFKSDKDAMYGENDGDFATNEVKLCYAQRFYIIKNYSGTLTPTPTPTPTAAPEIRDHRHQPMHNGGVTVTRPLTARLREAATVRDHRTDIRNKLLSKKMVQLSPQLLQGTVATAATSAIPTPAPRAGYVWVNDHWERKRAGAPEPPPPPPPQPVVPDSTYVVAAVLGRVIPWKPGVVANGGQNPTVTT